MQRRWDGWTSTYRRHGRPPHERALGLRGRGLLIPAVQRLQALQALPERGTQPLVRLGLVRENGVASRIRHVERIQESRPGRLGLVGDVAVPGDAVGAVVEEGAEALVLRAAVHEVDFGIALGGARGRVDMQAAEVAAEFEGVGDGEGGEVLVAEGDDFLLRDEEGEFVFACGG